MRRLVSLVAKRKVREIEHVLNNQVELNEEKLKSILKKNSSTLYGRMHKFDTISTPEQYAESVPLTDAKSMQPWIEKVHRNPTGGVLTSEDVIWYLMTSGTTGKPKKLPITRSGLKDTKTGSMYGWMSYMTCEPGNDRIVDGTMVTIGAPAEIERINGIPVGYATGFYMTRQNKIFQRLVRPGMDVFNMTDNEAKMWIYAKLIASSKTTVVQGIATLGLALLRRIQNEYGPALLQEFRGTKHEDRIKSALNDDGTMNLGTLCPDLRMFGSSGIDIGPYREWLVKILPQMTPWEFYGLSEAGLAGIQTTTEPGIQLLTNLVHMEFIPEREVESEDAHAIPLSEVKKGNRYEFVMTGANGWYRYRPGDLLTIASTDPYTVTKIARTGRAINMAGEKLSEAHVQNAISAASEKTGASVMDYTVVGMLDRAEGLPYYTLAAMFGDETNPGDFVIAFEDEIKATNTEFKILRETGALGPTQIEYMHKSFAEEVVRETHVQAKPIPLTDDTRVLDIWRQLSKKK